MTFGPYQLRVTDLVTDRNIGLIPVQDVEWDDYIGKTGSLSCIAPVPNQTFARRLRERVLPGRTMSYLEQGRRIVWGGPIWTRTPTADERGYITCPIQGAGLESVLRGHRQLTADKTYAATDQLDIARDLLAWDAAQPGGSLGLEVDAATSGMLRDRTYSRYDLPYIGTLLDQLAAVDGGFEWRIQCYADTGGTRHRAVRLGYPRLPQGDRPTILNRPGQIYRYSLPEDATRQANTWVSRGASVNNNLAATSYPLMSAQLTSPDLIAAGWPAWTAAATTPRWPSRPPSTATPPRTSPAPRCPSPSRAWTS
ncbi:hypothetical protein [Kitasatospora fiedleri]|uniref:hypothetical protein n=1 Tax=Kitasatospora fiedleri TaxID=2991545 RepID=UPI00249B9291|nr:hypothetical protein [Kitasatospora fiedleri]